MDENQKKLIQEQMQKIPPEVREAIEKSDWERIVFNVGRAHKMHVDDIDVLSIETILTMIGLEHPKDFPVNVQKGTGMSDDLLMDVIDEINEKLFSKIREALKVHYEKQSAGEIMDTGEKDELFHAGITLDDDHKPVNEKKNIETLVDKKLKEVEVVKAETSTPEVVVEEKPEPEKEIAPQVEEKPRQSFDPYREPLQ